MDDTGSGTELAHDPEILSDNPYFSRIWVVQEIASAKQALVLYERQAMHWDFFHWNLQTLSTKRWMRHFGHPRQIDDAREFLTLLGDTRNCNASDPRDKIFALLGLWTEGLEPDYTLSPQAVYTGLASILLTDENWEVVAQLLDMATHDRSMPGLPSWVPDWSEKSQRPYLREWRRSFPSRSLPEYQLKDNRRFRVHGQTGSLCIQAAEIDIMAPYLFRGFRLLADGMIIVDAGCSRISLAPEVLQKCEPTDCIFRLSQENFCLILRKKANPNIYSFIGLCNYSSSDNQQELDAIRYLLDWAWLLSLEQKQPWSEFSTWANTQVCWLSLRTEKKLETQLFLKRVIRKAQFLQRMRNLARGAQEAQSSYSGDKERWEEFFHRQWKKKHKQWQQGDEELLLDHQTLYERVLESYNLKLSHRHDVKEEEWAIFLHWLSRPTSPSYEELKDGFRRDIPLIWEGGFVTRAQLDEAHNRLDDNFNRYLRALSASQSSESSPNEIFAHIYREQFELLWMFFFRSNSVLIKGLRAVRHDQIGAQLARCFFWRFDRSIKQAYHVVRKRGLTQEECKKLWTKFLDWLTQGLFEEQAREVPSEVYDDCPRPLVDEKRSGLGMVYASINSFTHVRPSAFYRRPTLSELVQSEIWRRRLPERVFAFLFEDTETTTQPTESDDRNLEEVLAQGQPFDCGGPSVQGWRQENKSWKVVELYVSKSEWHMSCIKMDLLRGSKEEENIYKEIVII
ncbi:heterokaryon incompatibility het-6 [Fusarium coicis]|nr:heterokaryon incompatibility het-6 [Fusarium coicis]